MEAQVSPGAVPPGYLGLTGAKLRTRNPPGPGANPGTGAAGGTGVARTARARLAAVTPVDPAGPDRYRGGTKPWESCAPGRGGAADG